MCRLFVGQWLGSIVCPHVPLQANHGGLTQRRSFLSLKSTARLARRARNPQYIALASPIHEAGHNEEMIGQRSEEHTSELQSLMRISYAVFCLKKKKKNKHT